MQKLALIGLMMTGILASCGAGQTPTTVTTLSWTAEEVNAVSDLSELGKLSFHDGRVYLGDKTVDPLLTKGKFYGKNTKSSAAYDVIGFDSLNSVEQQRIKNISFEEIEKNIGSSGIKSQDARTCWGVFCTQQQSTISSQAAGYNLFASSTNLYEDISGCANPTGSIILKNNAVTQPNRVSYYLAVDSSIYFNNALKAKDFRQVGGTPGSQASGIPLEVSNSEARCFVPRPSPEGRGWHKGIELANEAALVTTTSDRSY